MRRGECVDEPGKYLVVQERSGQHHLEDLALLVRTFSDTRRRHRGQTWAIRYIGVSYVDLVVSLCLLFDALV